MKFTGKIWPTEEGQDVAEYAIMLAVLLVIAVSAIAMIGTNSNQVFSSVAQAIAQL